MVQIWTPDGERTIGDTDEELDAAIADVVAWKRPRKMRLTESVLGIPNPDSGTEFDDRFFVSIEDPTGKDLPPEVLDKARRLARLLWVKNPRAFGATEIVIDFVVGAGVQIRAVDPEVQAVLDHHWHVNQWSRKLRERLRLLALTGEQIYILRTTPDTGFVKVMSNDPRLVARVVRHPEDAEDFIALKTVERERKDMESPGAEYVPGLKGKTYRITRPQEDGTWIDDPVETDGVSFFFAVNRIAGATRGTPDMMSAIDWLEGLDGFTMALLERADVAMDIVWHMVYEGATKKDLKEKMLEFGRSLHEGAILGTNEKVKVNVVAPSIGSAEAEGTVKILKDHIFAGVRQSGLMLGDAEDLTRASAQEISIPITKAMGGRQTFVKDMLEDVLSYQIQQSVKAGRLDPAKNNLHFEVQMPPIMIRDLTTITAALTQLATAQVVAVEEGWISSDVAREKFVTALSQIGNPIREENVEAALDSVAQRFPDLAPAVDKLRPQIAERVYQLMGVSGNGGEQGDEPRGDGPEGTR